MQHINAMPLMPSDYNDKIPPAVDKMVMRAMCPAVDKRYQKVEQLYHDIEELRQNPNVNFAYDINNRRGEEVQNLEKTQAIEYSSGRIKRDESGQIQLVTGKQKGKKEKTRGLTPILTASIVVIIVFSLAIFYSFKLVFSDGKGEKIVVPKFVDLTIERSEERRVGKEC